MTRASIAAATAEDHLLAPEPSKTTQRADRVARVSTSGLILDRQTRALTEAGPGLDWRAEPSRLISRHGAHPGLRLRFTHRLPWLAACLHSCHYEYDQVRTGVLPPLIRAARETSLGACDMKAAGRRHSLNRAN